MVIWISYKIKVGIIWLISKALRMNCVLHGVYTFPINQTFYRGEYTAFFIPIFIDISVNYVNNYNQLC